MRLNRTLLLTGTILPVLFLSSALHARDIDSRADSRIDLAQATERDEPRGGRGGAERGGGAERERPAARPEPKEERAAPAAKEREREKPEPRPAARPEPRPEPKEERAPPAAREREKPEPRPAARPEPKEERAAPPAARERPESREERTSKPERAPAEKAGERPAPPSAEKPAPRPDRDDERRDRKDDQQQQRRDGLQERREEQREQRRENLQERRENLQERREDQREQRRENLQERRENLQEQREEQREQRRENLQERRENLQEQREEQRDQRRENLQERREEQRERREDMQERREDRQERREDRREDRRDEFNAPGRPGYVPGGFRSDDVIIRDYDRVRRDRQQYDLNGRVYYREPGRIIVRDRNVYFIRHDENERFRALYQRGYRQERRGAYLYSYVDRPGSEQIVTVVDDDGRLVRRYRRYRDGREVVIINNAAIAARPVYESAVDLPPPDIRIPRERYIVDYGRADPRAVYEALSAPPVAPLERRYSLDQVRYSPQLRARMPSVDINTITFDSGSFVVTQDQAQQLATIAEAINRAVKANPQEVFLIEGYTDAVGDEVDNLSLSDRRAQAVAAVLTETFQVPPENLTTQGYGEQYLRVNTQEPSRENRRVTVRRITPLLDQQAAGGDAGPPR